MSGCASAGGESAGGDVGGSPGAGARRGGLLGGASADGGATGGASVVADGGASPDAGARRRGLLSGASAGIASAGGVLAVPDGGAALGAGARRGGLLGGASAGGGWVSGRYRGKGKRPARNGSSAVAAVKTQWPAKGGPGGRSLRSGSCWAGGGLGVIKSSPSARKQKLTSATTLTVLSPVEPHEPKCTFCLAVNRNCGTLPSVMLGPFTRHNMRKSINVHVICAMWASEIFHDPEANELGNVIAAYNRSRGLKCTVCLTNGATVGCYVPTCQNVYHFCCLYGTPPPSLSLTDNNGKCKRHDDY